MKKLDSKHEKMEAGALLITGCPRSGTRAVTAYLEEHGVSLGHETAGEKGTVEWRHAYSEFDEENPAFIIQMTLIRDPIDTVRSLTDLLINCDRKSDTWQSITELSILGGWDKKLKELDWFGAAAMWWTTVYDRLYQFPMLKLEHLPKIKKINTHSGVDRTIDVAVRLNDYDDFWRVAKLYGYYKVEDDDFLG